MTRSLRPVDLLFTLGAIAFVAVLFGFQAASREVAGALGPLTVTEAVAFYSDELLLVRVDPSRQRQAHELEAFVWFVAVLSGDDPALHRAHTAGEVERRGERLGGGLRPRKVAGG